jgi:hypothetical protein
MTMKEFVLGVFSDGGAPSFSRVATGVVVGFACGWVTAIVRVTHTLPDFQGLSMFIALIYGVNVAGSVTAKVMTAKTGAPPEEGK